jgi:spore coat polysaccharide biosynthesis protein SpsF
MDNMVNNPYIIIQARMNSERLPSKVMKTIQGLPLIGILIERIKKADIPILLATSTNKENDELVDYVESLGIATYRGSENNVLKRFYEAAKMVNADAIIRVTGDNPLLDGLFLKEQYQRFIKSEGVNNYLSTGLSKSFPLGVSVEIFSMYLLEKAYNNSTLPGELEHVTPYMHQNKPGNINIVKVKRKENRYHYRLTVDTPEDFFLNKILIEEFACDKKNIEEIIQILDNNQELIRLNNSSIQKKWDE